MNDIKVSIVIPAYNEEKQLPRCLKSLMKAQKKHQSLELIVVDNNSSDNTSKVAKEFGATVLHEKKQGNVYALQYGLFAAKGDVILGTDADTEVTDSWITEAVRSFQNPDVVGATGPVFPRTKNHFVGSFFGNLYAFFLRFHFFINKPHFTGSNFAVRKKALQQVNGLDLRYRMSADVNLSLRLRSVGKVLYNPHMKVTASARRWHKPWKALREYTNGYINAVWLQKPPAFQQQSLT